MSLGKIIIAAPFGNWFAYPGATSTLGTFTLAYRGGFFYRLWRCLRTLRYDRRAGGWVNRLGLPNPGIDSLDLYAARGKIVSVRGHDANEWRALIERLRPHHADPIELNLSCPNDACTTTVRDVKPAINNALAYGMYLIAKLPPLRPLDLAAPLYDVGVRCFHCCNTLPTPSGGLSGKTLKPLSLWAVSELRQRYGDSVRLIGGGGVTHQQDVADFAAAGADHVAVASALLNPLNWRRVRRLAEGRT